MMEKDTATVLQINARSLKTIDADKNKMLQFKALVELKEADIISVCETWLHDDIDDEDILEKEDFLIHRRDREDREGGGVLVAVRNSIPSKHRKELQATSKSFNEIIVVEIGDDKIGKLGLISLYKPPDETNFDFVANLREAMINTWRAGMQKITWRAGMQKILLLGDFNMPEIKWYLGYPLSDAGIAYSCCELFSEFGMDQLNNNPSRKTNKNILDLVLTNEPEDITDLDTYYEILDTDHATIQFQLNIKVPATVVPDRGPQLNYGQTNFQQLNHIFANTVLIDPNTLDVDRVTAYWTEAVNRVLNNNIPKKKPRQPNKKPWIDSQVRHQSNIKDTARRKFQRTKHPIDWCAYREADRTLKYMIRAKHNEYVQGCANDIFTNPKKFWNFARRNSKNRQFPNTLKWKEEIAENAEDKANLFNNYFGSVFLDTSNDISPPIVPTHNPRLSSIQVSEEEVLRMLKNLDTTKSTGPDTIPAMILKHCAETLCSSLTHIINLSLASGRVPSIWKTAHICPVWKKGPKGNVTNYRPISILNISSKILERCVMERIMSELDDKLHPLQHGFRHGKSVDSQLILVYNEIAWNLDNNGQTDAVFLDFSKAFDSVCHTRLSEKLKGYGINGTLLQWFGSYLKDRKQVVVIEGCCSREVDVLSGVPQGSILGPILFLLYINDMPRVVSLPGKIALYADDAKLYMKIQTINDCIKLQEQLNKLSEWSKKWKLDFNASKCKVMRISRRTVPYQYIYTLNREKLEVVRSFVDLGITIESNLGWDVHIGGQIKKANRMFYYIKRTLGLFAPREAKKLLYLSLCRSHLELGTVAWTVLTDIHLKLIEALQRRATKYILNDKYMPYAQRLSELNLLPLSYRREQRDLMFTHKALAGTMGQEVKEIIPLREENRRSGRLANTMKIPKFKTESFAHTFGCRIVHIWNQLPANVRNIPYNPHSQIFKNAVIRHYSQLRDNRFDPERTCTWVSKCRCQ
jgi:hypothetical protein